MLLSALVTAKLVNVQVMSPDRYRDLGSRQRIAMEDLPGIRGTIRDRNGEDLALSVQLVNLIADPRSVPQDRVGEAVALIAGAVDIDEDEVTEQLGDTESRFAYIARQVDPRVADLLLKGFTDRGITGFFSEASQERIDPSGSLASAVIGRTDIDGTGTSGMELMYDADLRGTPGERIVERASDGTTIANADRLASPAVPGADLTLTVDQTLQYEAEQVLRDAVESEQASSGVVIIGDPSTGDLLAVANVSRDPETGEVNVVAYNMAFAAAYEAGSVLKLVTVAGAYQLGKTTPTEPISVPAELQVEDHTYSDHDWHPVSTWRPDEIVAQSSNIGTIMLGQRLEPGELEFFLRSFGFGAKTGLNVPGESNGILSSSADWYPTDKASISIGQGIAVTPIQLWSAYNIIANRGLYVAPRLVESVREADGTERRTRSTEPRRVISAQVAGWMNAALQNVVDEGTASQWQIPGYSVAAKTGTARKSNPDNGSYDWPDGYRYTTVLTGFLPASNPRLSITVLIDEPHVGQTGATAAGPVFNALAKAGLNHLRIPPDRPHLPEDGGETDSAAPVRATPATDGDGGGSADG